MSDRNRVILVLPSRIIARGLETILSEQGEFRVESVFSDLSRTSLVYMRSLGADLVVVDPSVVDYQSRAQLRRLIADHTDAAVVALNTMAADSEIDHQFDEIITVYDEPSAVVRKLRAALSNHTDAPDSDGPELSQREKDVLVCVAKGMQNKEIASILSLSVHTVISHRKNITRKTGIKTVAGLTVYALLNNLIDSTSIEQ